MKHIKVVFGDVYLPDSLKNQVAHTNKCQLQNISKSANLSPTFLVMFGQPSACLPQPSLPLFENSPTHKMEERQYLDPQ